ncbi:MAG: hypothetical protein R2789_11625 [Microthrixaceae bacterium]
MGRPLLIEIDGEELSRRLEPRDDALVLERTDLDEPGERRFGCVQGPFTIYERVARWQDAGPDRYRYEQYVRFRPAIPVFGPMFFGLMRRTLRDGLPAGRSPIWALPDRLSAQQSTVVAVMCLFHVIGGMLYAFLTNVLTFAAADLGNGSAGEQSVVLAVARVGAVLTIATMAFADRVGRRRVTIWAASAAVVLTVASAAAPNLAVLAVLQTLSRNLAIAAMLAADTLSIEEIPPGFACRCEARRPQLRTRCRRGRGGAAARRSRRERLAARVPGGVAGSARHLRCGGTFRRADASSNGTASPPPHARSARVGSSPGDPPGAAQLFVAPHPNCRTTTCAPTGVRGRSNQLVHPGHGAARSVRDPDRWPAG